MGTIIVTMKPWLDIGIVRANRVALPGGGGGRGCHDCRTDAYLAERTITSKQDQIILPEVVGDNLSVSILCLKVNISNTCICDLLIYPVTTFLFVIQQLFCSLSMYMLLKHTIHCYVLYRECIHHW